MMNSFADSMPDFADLQPPVPRDERADLGGEPWQELRVGDRVKALIEAYHREPRRFLDAWPNVVGSGFGLRISDPIGGVASGTSRRGLRRQREIREEQCLTLFVSQKVPRDQLRREACIPRSIEIEGVTLPTDVIALPQPPRLKQCIRNTFANSAPNFGFPIQGGLEIGPRGTNTFGTLTNVFRGFGGGRVWVTNNHVVQDPDFAFNSGQVIIQPQVGDPVNDAHNEIGDVDFFTPYFVPAFLSPGSFIDHLDAARGRLSIRNRNHPNPPNSDINLQCTAGRIQGFVPPFPGQSIRKSGATSVVTHGTTIVSATILQFATIAGVSFGTIPAFAGLLTALIGGVAIANIFSDDGDSGSAIVDDDSDGFSGLLWGGDDAGLTFFDEPRNVLLWTGVSV